MYSMSISKVLLLCLQSLGRWARGGIIGSVPGEGLDFFPLSISFSRTASVTLRARGVLSTTPDLPSTAT